MKRFVVSRGMALIYHDYQHEDGELMQTHRIGFGPPDFVAAFREAMAREPTAVEYRVDGTE